MGRKRGRRRNPFKLQLKTDTLYSILSIILWVIGGLIIVSFTGQGALLSKLHLTLRNTFGLSTFFIPFIFISAGLMISQVKWKVARPNVFLGSILIFIAVMGISSGGTAGEGLLLNIGALLHPIGAYLMLLGIGLIGLIIMSEVSLDELLVTLTKFGSVFGKTPSLPKIGQPAPFATKSEMKIKGADDRQLTIQDASHQEKDTEEETKPSGKLATTAASDRPDFNQSLITSSPTIKGSVWQEPSLSILSKVSGGKADRGDLNHNAATIENILDSFGIKARVVEVNCGPAVTQYALEISLGTKLSKITALQNDLALGLAAPTGQIRIEAPIPGRSLVGIEIPNRSPEFVTLRTMLTSDVMKKNKSKLTVSLGLNVSGEPIVADIAKMPHILIAGSTGSGKSVCLNSFLATILFRASPDEVKLILVDPKRVELTGYNGIPHLLTPVIVEPEKVVSALKWAVQEMQNRYKTFAEVGVRNVENYNELSGFQAMPYIVIVIDELADVMLFAPREVEEVVTKLAQMARATGIHLVLATQRPSVDVLTGLIKANIPARIAFNVTTMVDSRVILDIPGAEKLLGRGDMLYIPPTQSKPTRIQGAFVSDKEIKDLIDYLKQLGVEPQYTEEVTTQHQTATLTDSNGAQIEGMDDMFEEAVRAVCEYGRASASLLQRRLSIGYARAARIVDQLEQAGVISASDGTSKPRDVLIGSADDFFSKKQK